MTSKTNKPGCSKIGHDEDQFDSAGYKRCRQCRLIAKRRYDRKKHQQRRHQALEAYGGKCACCGVAEEVFLAIDHIENNGNVHRKEIRATGSVAMYRWLEKQNYPEGFQLLCHNCNYAKSRGVCPHQKDQQ